VQRSHERDKQNAAGHTAKPSRRVAREMREQRKFVCGFYGARDNYEIPVALHEEGLLELLVTDHYGADGVINRLGRGKALRSHPDLTAGKVRGSLGLTLARFVAARVWRDAELQNHLTDRALSRKIARTARRREAHVLTYEPYAVPRPPGGFPDGRKQIIFYYHPHVDMEDSIYREDEARWPKFHENSGLLASPWRRRTADAWKQADLVLCASSFTKQSLVAAGMEEERGVVVPYGTAQPKAEVTKVTSSVTSSGSLVTGPPAQGTYGSERDGGQVSGFNLGALKLLFVGRNPLRKGLHHLLMAWNTAEKRQGDLLTIVCAAKPLEMQRLVKGRDDVRWLYSVSGEELGRLYAEADALVVPSLCEGFGHVYLEAMGRGCAVVGTRNSALPDIGDETQGVFTVDVGDAEGLARLISDASADPVTLRRTSEAARKRASEFTWERFRQELVEATRSLL